MKSKRPLSFSLLLALACWWGFLAEAQPHRATHLGLPATRFAPPLVRPGDLRARFRDEKLRPDIASILEQWGWKGNLDDLYYAALTAEITEVKLPVGYRMPFMSSRENGKPICLRDVIWEGKQPISAYAFSFSSNGRRYRCVTPKPCSNFFLEDLGAEPTLLELTKTAPADVTLCDPLEMKVSVRNGGRGPLTQVHVTDSLPAGLKTPDNRTALAWDAGTLRPGESREFRFPVVAFAVGEYVNQAHATSAEGAIADATARTVVRAPALSLECKAPSEVYLGRPAHVCLTLRNTGTAAEARTTISLPIPASAVVASATENGVISADRVTWEIADFATNAVRQLCAVLSLPEKGTLAFNPEAHGVCAPRVQSSCATRVVGVPGILLEVVDVEDPIEVGNDVTYVITVTNQGSLTGTNLRLQATLPESQEFVSGTGPTAVRAEGRNVTLEALPRLESKAVAEWHVVVKARQVADARFQLELRSDQFERPILEMESTQQY